MRVLILLPYYERPKLVRNALESVANSRCPHWRLTFIDDGSKIPGEPIVREILADHIEKVICVRLNVSAEEKLLLGGGTHGKAMNDAIRGSDCDVGIMLCDDDELHPDYLGNLLDYFGRHKEVTSCYSKVIAYNPLVESSRDAKGFYYFPNDASGPINGCCRVDASMVAWRLSANKEYGVWFEERRSKDHDADFYTKLYQKTGPMYPTGFMAQYKGVHPKQLGSLGPYVAWTEPERVDK